MDRLDTIEAALIQFELQAAEALLQPWWLVILPIGAAVVPALTVLIIIAWIIRKG